ENSSCDCFCGGRCRAGSCAFLHKKNHPCNGGILAAWCKGACIGALQQLVRQCR
ncbi:hypothetical protein NDU88_010473, partial [Pleurodeles waltl]